jgi:hypothetical protein
MTQKKAQSIMSVNIMMYIMKLRNFQKDSNTCKRNVSIKIKIFMS